MNKKILIKSEFIIVANDDISDNKGLLKKANSNYRDIYDFMPIDTLNNDNNVRFLLHDILDHVVLNKSFMTILNETLALLVNNYRSQFYHLSSNFYYRSHREIHISEINKLFRNFLDNNFNEVIHINDLKKEIKKYERLLVKSKKIRIKILRKGYKESKNMYINDVFLSLKEVLSDYENYNNISSDILNDLFLHYKSFYRIADYLAYLVNEFYYEQCNFLDCRQISEEVFYKLKNMIDENKYLFDDIQYFDKFIFTLYNDYSFKINIHLIDYSNKFDREIIKKYCLKSDNY